MKPNGTILFLRWMEGVSIALIVGAIVYAVVFLKKGDIPQVPVAVVNMETSFLPTVNADLGPADGFDAMVDGRDLFNLPPPPVIVPKPVEIPVVKPVERPRDLEVLPANLKVVAVIVEGEPQVVIEDMNLKKTFFISTGPEKDGFRIDSIKGRKIYLSYYGLSYIIPFGR
jgi:hypothetical protein